MKSVKITQVRSQIGQTQKHRGTLRALGLGKIGRSVEHTENPELAGMLSKVRHLVRVEDAWCPPSSISPPSSQPRSASITARMLLRYSKSRCPRHLHRGCGRQPGHRHDVAA